MCRRVLDSLYLASGYVSGFFLVGICALITAQILGRLLGLTLDFVEMSGFCLAANTYFGLAYTFHSGGHIRITMLLGRLSGAWRRVFELWCCGTGTILSGYFAYHSILLLIELHRFGDMSRGLYAVPFWIPQSSMAIGLVVLTIAFADALVCLVLGRTPGYAASPDSEADAAISGGIPATTRGAEA